MHGRPEGFDPKALVGRALTQVCLGEHQVILRFDGADISIEVAVSLIADGMVRTIDGAVEWSDLVTHLGASIERCEMSADATLTLGLTDGSVVEVPDSERQHESYQVTVDRQRYVV